MDPLTHTLLGGTLATAGLERRSALALPTLLIGANLPDIDVVAYIHGADAGLHLRRGWTHGPLAMVVLPVVLTLLMVAFDSWRRRRGHEGPPVRPWQLLLLSMLSVWSHPFLDWLNTYGVRVLMPFSGHWFYGDALFVVDPWVWLLLGGAVFLNHSVTSRQRSNWAAVGLVATVFLFLTAEGHHWAPWLWTALLSGLVVFRWRSGPTRATTGRRLARLALVVFALYVAGMIGLTSWARGEFRARLHQAGITPTADLMAGPDRFDPLARLLVAPMEEGYRVGRFHPLERPRLRIEQRVIADISPPALPGPTAVTPVDVVTAARSAECVLGMVRWARFPFHEVDATEDGYKVFILDARYVRRRAQGFGGVTVHVGTDLAPGECGGGVSLP